MSTTTSRAASAVVTTCVLLLASCGSDAPPALDDLPRAGATAAATGGPPGTADASFVVGLVRAQLLAEEMSVIASDRASSDEVRTLAEEVVTEEHLEGKVTSALVETWRERHPGWDRQGRHMGDGPDPGAPVAAHRDQMHELGTAQRAGRARLRPARGCGSSDRRVLPGPDDSDLADSQGGTTREGVHIGAMAGTVDMVLRCFSGLEIRDGVLWLHPALPPELPRAAFTVVYRGQPIDVELTRGGVRLHLHPGAVDDITVCVEGQISTLSPGDVHVVAPGGTLPRRQTPVAAGSAD